MSNDNWSHRNKNMRCETCTWFVFKQVTDGKLNHLGRCRKKAPSLNGSPATFGTDWCGEHKLDENKI